MKTMKFNFAVLCTFLIALALSVQATTFKRGLSLKQVGNQNHYEWTGTCPLASSDVLQLWVDTTNSYGINPTALLYNKKVNIGRDAVYPGEKFPEKYCVSVKSVAQADSTTTTLKANYASTRGGTFVAENTSVSLIHPGTTATIDFGGVPYDPNSFFMPSLTVSSATDSLYPTIIKVWPCDD